MMDERLLTQCQSVMAKHARSFRFAAQFLPAAARRDASVAYAFCRLVDDAVDEATSERQAEAEIGRLGRMLAGQEPKTALVSEYVEMCERLGVGLVPAFELLSGAASDLMPVRVADDECLAQYCYRVAGTVGLMMCGVMGVRDPRAYRHAIDLGMAMQLTNICRDVLEDAKMGRVYLPESRLVRAGLSQERLLELIDRRDGRQDEESERRLATVVGQLLSDADALYESGRRGLEYLPGRSRFAIMVASALYRQIGVRLTKCQHGNALLGRAKVPFWAKLALATREFFKFLRGDFRIAQLQLKAR